MPKYENCSGQRILIDQQHYPESVEDIVRIIGRAANEGFVVHPVSVGNNWGYGTRIPYDQNAHVVNLSKMNKILEFNPDLRFIKIQPGVTQKQLSDFLKSQSVSFFTPTTGAGEHASILGNTLERGFGLTPWVDHFYSLTAIEAVMASGEIYRSPYARMGCEDIASVYKWGIGPYIDGLFSQGQAGIVTSGTILLQPKPEEISMVVARADSDQELFGLVADIQSLIVQSGGIIAGTNYINSLRNISMVTSCLEEAIQNCRPLDQGEIEKLQTTYDISPWTIIITLFGGKNVVKEIEQQTKKIFRHCKRRPLVLNEKKFNWVRLLTKAFPSLNSNRIVKNLNRAEQAFELFEGTPKNFAHQLTFWRSPQRFAQMRKDVDRRETGLIWYAPVIPMTAEYLKKSIEHIYSTTRAFGFDPLLTLTANNDRYFIGTLALCFSRTRLEEVERAHNCFRALCQDGLKNHIFPYRIGTLPIEGLTWPEDKIKDQIKNALDPLGTIDPGRFI